MMRLLTLLLKMVDKEAAGWKQELNVRQGLQMRRSLRTYHLIPSWRALGCSSKDLWGNSLSPFPPTGGENSCTGTEAALPLAPLTPLTQSRTARPQSPTQMAQVYPLLAPCRSCASSSNCLFAPPKSGPRLFSESVKTGSSTQLRSENKVRNVWGASSKISISGKCRTHQPLLTAGRGTDPYIFCLPKLKSRPAEARQAMSDLPANPKLCGACNH